jgi:hypothetical protein
LKHPSNRFIKRQETVPGGGDLDRIDKATLFEKLRHLEGDAVSMFEPVKAGTFAQIPCDLMRTDLHCRRLLPGDQLRIPVKAENQEAVVRDQSEERLHQIGVFQDQM